MDTIHGQALWLPSAQQHAAPIPLPVVLPQQKPARQKEAEEEEKKQVGLVRACDSILVFCVRV